MEKLILHYRQHDDDCKGKGGGYCKCDMDKTMEFDEVTDNEGLYWFQSEKGYKIPHGLPIIVNSPYKAPKLNPKYIEIIEEQECPECDGFGNKDGEICTDCKPTGVGVKTKIEVVTSWTVFNKSKKEYDEKVISDAYLKIEKFNENLGFKDTSEFNLIVDRRKSDRSRAKGE